jgi:hypothetical protein
MIGLMALGSLIVGIGSLIYPAPKPIFNDTNKQHYQKLYKSWSK